MKTAFIFPAFISEYIGTENLILDQLGGHFTDYLTEISSETGDDFSSFSIENKAFTDNELPSQLISYAFSCCLSDILARKKISPDYLAGYSMGLYAALYTGGAIDFKNGVKLIAKAFEVSKSALKNVEAGMGSIIGLTEKEIMSIAEQDMLSVEIANTNSKHAFLVTGELQSLKKLLESAKHIGALNTAQLNVNTPYHSRMLKSTQEEFGGFIDESISFKPINNPIISSLNQSVISTHEQIRNEIVENLFQRIDWLHTFNKLLDLDVNTFIECGAGKSLQKIARFIPGNYQVYPMNKVEKLFN